MRDHSCRHCARYVRVFVGPRPLCGCCADVEARRLAVLEEALRGVLGALLPSRTRVSDPDKARRLAYAALQGEDPEDES